jgi:hypothetical protein
LTAAQHVPIHWNESDGETMLNKDKPQGQRIINLIHSVRQIGFILPGEKVEMIGEKPATYLGSIEEGDIQVDYLQIHKFELSDCVQVVLENTSLNRSLGKLLYTTLEFFYFPPTSSVYIETKKVPGFLQWLN